MLQTHFDTIQNLEILEWIFEDRGPEGIQAVLQENQQDLAHGRDPWIFIQDWNSSVRQALFARRLAGDSVRIVGLRGLGNGPTTVFMTEVMEVLKRSEPVNRIEYMCPSDDAFRSVFLGLGFRSLAAVQQICLPLKLTTLPQDLSEEPNAASPPQLARVPDASDYALGVSERIHDQTQDSPDAAMSHQLRMVPAHKVSSSKLARVFRNTFEDTLDLATNSPVEGLSDQMLIEYFSNGIPLHHLEHWYLAELAGEMIGCLLMQMHPQKTMELVYMGLNPLSRRRGIGSQLVERARLTALENYCSMLVTAVDSQNHPALRVYERAGFQRYSKIEWLSFAVQGPAA